MGAAWAIAATGVAVWMKREAERVRAVGRWLGMNAEKLRDRTKSVALKTLAAVEVVEQRIASGETGAALRHAAEQIRGAVESLLALDEPPPLGGAFLDTDTRCLAAHLDSRVKAIEEQLAAAGD